MTNENKIKILTESLEDAKRRIEMMIDRMPLDKLVAGDSMEISKIIHVLNSIK